MTTEHKCKISTGICGSITAGTGKLDRNGYWEFPCDECANELNYAEDARQYTYKRDCDFVKAMESCDRYLLVHVLMAVGMDCTNGGVTSKQETLFIPHPKGPFEYADIKPARLLQLIKPAFPGCPIRAKPASLAVRCSMFGGNYVSTSDARFSEAYGGPVAVHDRVE